MSPKRLYDRFKESFPWFVPNVVRYKENRADGGIDVYLDTGEVLNYQLGKKGSWTLKRGEQA